MASVRIRRPAERLEALTGAVVVLDVFRASNTVLSLLAAGAAEVLLLADLDRARALAAAHPGWPLLGERGGLPPRGFDGGNSPAAAARLVTPGASILLTTSAGTQAAHRLAAASAVLFASFANAAAVVHALRRMAPRSIALLPMGLEARTPALEDDLAAEYLAAALGGAAPPFAPIRERLLSCPGADRLRRLGQEADLDWCTRLDVLDLVPRVTPGDPPAARLPAR